MSRELDASSASGDRDNEERSAILEHMSDGVLLVGAGEEVLEFNPSLSRLWVTAGSRGKPPREGARLSEVLPQLPPDLTHGDEACILDVDVDPMTTPPTIFKISVSPVRGEVRQDGAAGRAPGHLLVLSDVTAARELENLQRHFLSMVTHELKTPLTSVLGYTRVMLMGKGGELTEKQREFITIIDEQADQLRGMIQDMLDMTRLEAGSLSIEAAPVKAANLLESARTAHDAAAQVRGLELRLEQGGLAGEQVLGDAARLAQVLGNLVGNALKFTPRGGRITLLGGRDGERVWLAVQDTGRGIPAAAIPRLFDKFYQVERGDTRRQGGAGLGLYICRELVREMNGSITAESTPGEGSRFTVSLPLHTSSEQSEA